MKKEILLSAFVLLSFAVLSQVPASWNVTGIGGGGALFSPTINQGNTNEYYAACDMSEQFHTTDFGLSYNIIDFRQLQAFHNSAVRFTNTNVRYSINYANNLIVPVKSTDGGVTWTTLAGNPDASQETFSIWADYNNPNRVIISYYAAIYFSSDGGTNFTNIHNELNNATGIVIGGAFFDGNNIYLGTNDGLIESFNGGTSFSTLTVTGIPSGEFISSFAAAKQNGALSFFCLTGANVYAGQPGSDYYGFIRGVYSMNNNSGTWVSRMSGITTSSDYLMYVGMAENDTSTAYLGGGSSAGNPDIMKTTNGGMTWSHVFNTSNNSNIVTGWCGAGGDHQYSWPECLFGMAVAATDKNKVIFTDYSDVMKTSDGATTWQQAYVSSADQHPAGANTPTKQYYHSVGLENTSAWFPFWNDANNIFVGFTDIFAIRSKDGGSSWAFDYTASATNTIYCITKNISNSTIYAGTSSIHDIYKSYRLQDNPIDAGTPVGKILFSSDNGATWTILHDFAHPVYWLATDPNNANRMYAAVVNHNQGAGGIWMTNNLNLGASSTWTHLAAPPRTQGHPATMTVLNNGKMLCSFSARRDSSGAFTNSSGIFLYDPVATTWTDKSDAGQHYWCHDVIVDPNDATQNTWYSGVYSGWGGPANGLGGLYKTTNGGTTWTRIFNSGDVSSCTFNPNNANELFIATMGNGLWYSTNINAATPAFNQVSSYNFSAPERIFFNPFDQTKIWVASFGHGLQWGDITQTTVNDLNSEGHGLVLYPNPTTGIVTLNIGEQTSDAVNNLKLFNLVGSEIKGMNFHSVGNKILLDASVLPAGIYFVQLKLNDGLFTGKLVKE